MVGYAGALALRCNRKRASWRGEVWERLLLAVGVLATTMKPCPNGRANMKITPGLEGSSVNHPCLCFWQMGLRNSQGQPLQQGVVDPRWLTTFFKQKFINNDKIPYFMKAATSIVSSIIAAISIIIIL